MTILADLNKLIYNKVVYVRVNDLTELFEGVSLYRIKKTISEMGLETKKLKGFGNGLYIKEVDTNKIIIDGKSVILSTKIRTLNGEIKQTQLLNRMFGSTEEVSNEYINDTINKFIEIEDYVSEEVGKPELTEEDAKFNKEMEDRNIGFRKVYVGLKHPSYGKTNIFLLIDKDNNIICEDPYHNYFEIKDDKFYIDWNEKCTENIEDNYNIKIPVQTGQVIVNEDKIIKELLKFAYSQDFEDDDYNGRIYNGKIHLTSDDIYLLHHKDTMFTGVVY